MNAAGVAGGGAEQQGRVEREPVPWSQCRGDSGAVAKRKGLDTDVLHRRAQVAVLAGLVRGDDVYDLITAAASNHVPGWFSPDVALLELAVTALDIACPPGAVFKRASVPSRSVSRSRCARGDAPARSARP